jgi:putative ABC transport system permease protein
MNLAIHNIAFEDILWMLLPVGFFSFFYIRYTKDWKSPIFSVVRMSLQLIIIGYLLLIIFKKDQPVLTVLILFIMLGFATTISLRPIYKKDRSLYIVTFISIAIGSIISIFFVIFATMKPQHIFEAKTVIPLFGMSFANAMNSVSLLSERFFEEIEKSSFQKARKLSLQASMIPTFNSLFAVGIVTLPGFMTGQILSGVDPIVAVRYQMVVMLMILISSGLSVICWLLFIKNRKNLLK